MKWIANDGKQRVRMLTGSVAFLMGLGISLVLVFPVFSQVAPGNEVICYSIVTLEAGADLKDIAARYNTTVAEIQQNNSTTSLRPGATLTLQENTKRASQPISRGLVTSWNWPVKGEISQTYGMHNGDFHHGLDIAIPSGKLIRAARAGKVIKADWFGVYGLTVMIDHGNGVQTLYAHNSKIMVKVGDIVTGGDEISLSGSTGNSTGPHLHFEIRLNGRTVDPQSYLPKTQLASY
ncbi:MAG TPA: peptidoglycan DD-metalloendopeptidase family protein [Desulfosporosinus sp.]|nr:peptidoglycan DD-metalloendopeptidase family protein [Desulfosporosinus sp.]